MSEVIQEFKNQLLGKKEKPSLSSGDQAKEAVSIFTGALGTLFSRQQERQDNSGSASAYKSRLASDQMRILSRKQMAEQERNFASMRTQSASQEAAQSSAPATTPKRPSTPGA